MAKTNGSLFSLGAHGSIAKTLTFSKRKSGQQARRYNKPLKDPSPKQRAQRRLTEFLVAQWQNMSDVDKATWDANARVAGLNLPGYHYFLREAQRDLYRHHGLVAYWHLNEYVDGKVLDLSGNGLDGTPKPSYPTNVPTLLNAPSAKFGKFAKFDGIDEYIQIAHNSIFNFGTQDFSIAFRIYFEQDQNVKYIMAKTEEDVYEEGFHVRIDTGPRIQFITGDTDGTFGATTSILPIKTWLDVVCRRIADYQWVFVNGAQVGVGNVRAVNVNTATDLLLGCTWWIGAFFIGSIDEVCIYNRAFSNAEIATRYNFSRRGTS